MEMLHDVDPSEDWRGPKGFRDIAAHWYEDFLDHRLIWRAVTEKMPPVLEAIDAWLSKQDKA